MKVKKLLTLALCLTVALTAITSCQDDDNWQPIWAMPVVKQMNLEIGEYVDDSQVADFNAKIKDYWRDYVDEELGVGGGTGTVDSVAYEIITKPNGNDPDGHESYVNYTGPGGAPQLNQDTENKLLENGNTQDQINEINEFLLEYWTNNPQVHIQTTGKRLLKKAGVAVPRGGGVGLMSVSGSDAISNLLNGIVGNSNDVFITAANLIDHMGGDYVDSIEHEVDELLAKASMDKLIDLNLRDLIKAGSQVYNIDLSLDLANSLPFSVAFKADFVDDNDNVVRNLFDATLGAATPEDGEEKTSEKFSENQQSKLNQLLDDTKGVKLSVVCQRNQAITSHVLRTLSQKGITFSMRVKLQAQMKDIMDSF